MKKRTKACSISSTSLPSKRWTPLLVSYHLSPYEVSLIPSKADGHKLVYDREVPFELRIQDSEGGPQEVGTLEAVRVKVLVLVSRLTLEDKVLRISYRVEMTTTCRTLESN